MMITFLKYALVGLIGTVLDVGVFALLMSTSLNESTLGMVSAATISFVLAVVNNFHLNRRWTFRAEAGPMGEQFVKFFSVSSGGWVLNTFFLMIFSLTIPPVAAKIGASAVVLFYNFLANRFWTFSGNASA